MDIPAALAACTTQADHYRVQMLAENTLDPAAALALHARIDALPAESHEWVRRLADMVLRTSRWPNPTGATTSPRMSASTKASGRPAPRAAWWSPSPALAFGPIIGAAMSLGLGGMSPAAMQLAQAPGGLDRGLFRRMLAGASPGRTRLVCAHGEGCQRYAVRGSLLAMSITACRVLVVAGVTHHGVVADLFLANVWRRFVDEVLLGDTLPPDGVWRPGPVPLSQPAPDSPG
ncbi:hypothetical protein [Neoroseomonas lacus]|uniref:Uncharacterized protein n=1 Tax=Neoroseomonas lacus TaxID=287609 RepID=A0A917KUV9_9PROT|nr:hypothetical protein [Neoroseomonas lacus]GGJ29110.1 hypothetical protein GCM10011320_40500 [Neoroseomonas lacus]